MKIALVFPGYGSQYVGMGKELYDEYRIVQEYFEEASNCGAINFVKLCFASSDSEISKLVNAYSSLFVIGGSVFALLKEQGVTPDVVVGFNNGETTALFAAGCFSIPDGLYLINKMSAFFEEALEAMDVEVMQVVGRTAEQLEQDCRAVSSTDGSVVIALYNGPSDHVVVGPRDQVSQLRDALELHDGVKIEYGAPEIGLHSGMMNGVVDQLKAYLEKVDFKDVAIPVVSGLDGTLITQGAELKERFIRHMNEPLRSDLVMRALANYDMIIVATPAEQLGKLLKKQYPEKTVVTIDKKADIEAFKEVVQANI
jgi:[acyl-carrier-protein] S-malonyltransferase